MNTTIKVTRNMRGELEAENDINMTEPGRVLRISTHKTSGGMIVSRAQCGIVSYSIGMRSFRCALGLGGGGDFSKRALQVKGRATEKAIAAQHAEALAMKDALLAEAEAYYIAKPKEGTKLDGDVDGREGIAATV